MKKNYQIKNRLTKPKNYHADALFEFCISKLGQRDFPDSIQTHNQWASFIFGVGNSTNQHYLSKVTFGFGRYLKYTGLKYSWDYDSIYMDFPDFFFRSQTEIASTPKKGFFGEILEALDDEKAAAIADKRNHTYRVEDLNRVKLPNGKKIYAAKLDLEEEEEPKLFEDLPITYQIGGVKFDAVVLDYDAVSSTLYFDYAADLEEYYGDHKIIVDASWILDKLRIHILDLQEKGISDIIIRQFIENNFSIQDIASVEKDKFSFEKMDESQQEAFEKSINKNISLIWGPPGTGKSHTLGFILQKLFEFENEKTLVCCIANVAVDALAEKLVNTLEESGVKVGHGEILRIGHTRSQKLLQTDYLFPNNPFVDLLRKQINELNEKVKNTKSNHEQLALKQELQKKRDELKKIILLLIQNSRLIFCTASKFYIDETISEMQFDNLIIDEASMMSVPHFVALAKKIKKRIIVAGDFRQLGPVVLAQSSMAKKWLVKDIFAFSGIKTNDEKIQHPALSQLLKQRRSHPEICEIINQPFYEGKLISDFIVRGKDYNKSFPFVEKEIVYLPIEDSVVTFAKGGSRLNESTRQIILQLITIYNNVEDFPEIGIISPYRAQVTMLTKEIKKLILGGNESKIKIGTIHSFQGSEADIIILDILDDLDKGVGKLYQFDTGRRLINVAISRARFKLIVVGNLKVFTEGRGANNVDTSVKKISKTIERRKTEYID